MDYHPLLDVGSGIRVERSTPSKVVLPVMPFHRQPPSAEQAGSRPEGVGREWRSRLDFWPLPQQCKDE